jgi:RING-box protein 1
MTEIERPVIMTELPKPDTEILDTISKICEPTVKPVFDLLHWAPTAYWSWNIKEDTCTICRNNIMDMCIECTTNNRDGSQCHLSKGTCSHIFHKHCIEKWLQAQTTCPIDTQAWGYEKEKVDMETS